MALKVFAAQNPAIVPCEMPARFRHDVTYFVSHPSNLGKPALPPGEYYLRLEDARRILDDGVVTIVSPLDSASQTELEITEDQERWLEWVIRNNVDHIRLQS